LHQQPLPAVVNAVFLHLQHPPHRHLPPTLWAPFPCQILLMDILTMVWFYKNSVVSLFTDSLLFTDNQVDAGKVKGKRRQAADGN
jgi:hypothetical protein